MRLIKINSWLIPCFLLLNACQGKKVNNCEKFNHFLRTQKDVNKNANIKKIVAEVLKNDTTCIEALLLRADILVNENQINLAKRDYSSVSRLSYSNVYALYKLGLLCIMQDDYKSAFMYFDKALNLKNKNGVFVDNLNHIDKASINYDVETIELVYQLAVCSYYLGKLKTALNYFNLCISQNYDLSQAYLYRGAVKLESGNKSEGCDDLFHAQQLGNANASEYILKYCK